MREAALFLFNRTLIAPRPWHKAGYECHLVDNAFTEQELALNDGYIRHKVDLMNPWLPPLRKYVFACAWVPCTHTAVSGAKHFINKGIEALHESLTLYVRAKEIIQWSQTDGFIENPIGTFSTYAGKADFIFHPWWYTGFCPEDNYTKPTCLWKFGDFKMPEKKLISPKIEEAIDWVSKNKPKGISAQNFIKGDLTVPEWVKEWHPDDRIHKALPGEGQAEFRNATPMGFSLAIFEANAPEANNVS